jgi:hypothetical protein
MEILHQVHTRSGRTSGSEGEEEVVSEELISTFWKRSSLVVNVTINLVLKMDRIELGFIFTRGCVQRVCIEFG